MLTTRTHQRCHRRRQMRRGRAWFFVASSPSGVQCQRASPVWLQQASLWLASNCKDKKGTRKVSLPLPPPLPPPLKNKKKRQFTTWLCCALLLHQSPDFFSPPGLRKQCKDEGVCDQGRMPYECLCSKNDTLGSLACHKGHPLKSKKAQKQGAKGWSISKEGDSYPSMAWYIRDVHFSGWKHCHCTASGACCMYTSSPLLMSRAATSLMHPPI